MICQHWVVDFPGMGNVEIKDPPSRKEREQGGAPSRFFISSTLGVAGEVVSGFSEQSPGFAMCSYL